MKKFVRFAGVALLALTITIGVASCGDDAPVTPVAPPAPPTPPPALVVVTMSPASQTIGVGGTVVFAVSVSGGVAGEAASWTCDSSDPSLATVTMTSAGCAATAVAAGGVTITAAVTKGGVTVNTAAGLTITEDMAERASLFIASIKDSDSDSDEDDGVLSRTVSVTLSVEFGDQMRRQLSVLVDGVVAEILSFEGASAVAASQDEPAQQAVHPFVLSFNSADYDAVTGEPTYMNGKRTISAELMVVGSDEPIESGFHPREFDNEDGVHVVATPPSESKRASDGGVWYGGPGTMLEITAIMVAYSGSSADAVTMLGFCGADAASKEEAPYEFAPDCAGKKRTTADATPEFNAEVAGGAGDLTILNDKNDIFYDIFPINLDFEGPEIPVFKVNPNGREGGWINEAVKLTGKYSGTSNKDGWLTYGAGGGGVGGYIAQLRYSTSDPRVAASARAAAPSTSPELPAATSSTSKICFVASATDLLGNQSALPKATADCVSAAVYAPLASAYRLAVKAVADASDPDAAMLKAVTSTRGEVLVGFLAGVDITGPTAEFAISGLDEDAREIDDEFEVIVEDNSGGSGIQTLTKKFDAAGKFVSFVNTPLIASLEVRDTKGTKCVIGGKVQTSPSLCADPFDGIDADDDLVMTNVVEDVLDKVGYYTFTARAQDKAGNLSEEINRVALRDEDFEADAGVRVTHGTGGMKVFDYNVDISVRDDLSVRDYYLAMSLGAANGAAITVAGGPGVFRLGSNEVDAYNASDLMTVFDMTEKPKLPFLALQTNIDGAATNVSDIDVIQVYVRDQREANQIVDDVNSANNRLYAMDEDDANVDITVVDADDEADDAIPGVATFTVTLPDGMLDGNDDIDLTATVTVAIDADTPFKRVYFYAESKNNEAASLTTPAVEDWRLIGSLRGSHYDDEVAGEYVYTLKVGADEVLDIMVDDEKEDYMEGKIIAIGLKDDIPAVKAVDAVVDAEGDVTTPAVVAVPLRVGKVGLLSTGTPGMITINR